MNDHDRQRWHGPLQPASPDPWHDRPRFNGTQWAIAAVLVAGLAVFINALAELAS